MQSNYQKFIEKIDTKETGLRQYLDQQLVKF